MKIVIATKNVHKVEEFRQMLDRPGVEIDVLPSHLPDATEDGLTFAANAEKKARFYSQYVADIVLADDSGLTVPVLQGEPGVFSARYAGVHGDDQANNEKLIARLHGQGVSTAPAFFVCALSACRQGAVLLTVEGRVEGFVSDKPTGQNGFGYDPLFTPNGQQKRFAEMTMAEKGTFSHRAKAIEHLIVRFGELTL